MIVLQSTATGMAERPIGNPKSAARMFFLPLPSGESWGEGEPLKRKSFPIYGKGELNTNSLESRGRLDGFVHLDLLSVVHLPGRSLGEGWCAAVAHCLGLYVSNPIQAHSCPFKTPRGASKPVRLDPAIKS